MRKDFRFVVLLVVLCLGLATMAAVSSSPTNGEKPEFEGFDSLDEATVTENWKRYFPAQYEGWTRTAEMQQTAYGGGGHAEAEGMEINKIDYT